MLEPSASDGRLAPVLAQQWGPALVFWATPGIRISQFDGERHNKKGMVTVCTGRLKDQVIMQFAVSSRIAWSNIRAGNRRGVVR